MTEEREEDKDSEEQLSFESKLSFDCEKPEKTCLCKKFKPQNHSPDFAVANKDTPSKAPATKERTLEGTQNHSPQETKIKMGGSGFKSHPEGTQNHKNGAKGSSEPLNRGSQRELDRAKAEKSLSEKKDIGSPIAKKIFRNAKVREEMMKWKKVDIIDFFIETKDKFRLAVKRLKDWTFDKDCISPNALRKVIDKIMGDNLI